MASFIPPHSSRFFWVNWWRRLPAQRQDRLMALVPLLAVLLFVAVVLVSINFLRMEASRAQLVSVQRDGEYVAQRITARMGERQDNLQRLAHMVATRHPTAIEFDRLVSQSVHNAPELRDVSWLDSGGIVVHAQYLQRGPELSPLPPENPLPLAEERALVHQTGRRMAASYGLIRAAESADPTLALVVPVVERGNVTGYLFARYNPGAILYYAVPAEMFKNYSVSLLDRNLRVVSGQTAGVERSDTPWWLLRDKSHKDGHTTVLPALENVVALHLNPLDDARGVAQRGMYLMVLALSGLTAWMLLANWRHLRRRQRSQQALLAETSFRRAMENSLLTGMRALDRDGRISYVNAAFGQMTGWSQAELVGQLPPYSFWHPDDHERNREILDRTLRDHIPQGGYQMRVLRKNGTTFDARMYMAPLVTADGDQTGWISSMTDITESNRVKQQLTNAYERFTRVLDGLDVAVSVAPLGSKELLFANHAYRLWYGDDNAAGHMELLMRAGSPGSSLHKTDEQDDILSGLPTAQLPDVSTNNSEIYVPQLDRWIEVRSRYLEWVDGRLAQMLVATDITARRHAEEQSAQHEARAQATSRLVTMGEMASSVAHELNQPLTAINNYCNGMLSRLHSGQLDQEALVGALEKTSRQAQRAGQIVQRIRSFVKRSTPNYTRVEVDAMVAEAVELSEVELRRRNVRLRHEVAPGLPVLLADKILIEQVLINLIKNGIESIDQPGNEAGRREVRLQVSLGVQAGRQAVEFAIEDSGKGMSDEAQAHLFEAFFTTKREGMGIGLNLCRSIVESHQGRLQAQNLYNNAGMVSGCRFSFWIPVPPATLSATPKA